MCAGNVCEPKHMLGQEENINKRPRKSFALLSARKTMPRKSFVRKAEEQQFRTRDSKRAEERMQHGNTGSGRAPSLAAEQQLRFRSHPSQSPDKVVVAFPTASAPPESCCCCGI